MFKFIILFYFVLICQQSFSEKRVDKNELIDDCTKCKVVSDSFTFWFKKTSRGKYDGGDAAWEESKLKSYAQSEIRLAEIQENLCSELKNRRQDYCYALSEEIDQVLESWWAHKNVDTGNLYPWLCIENLKYCCPKNHYGEVCNLCPMKNNKVCNGQGRCNGDETREGNGSCICNPGYTGTKCEECDQNYLNIDGMCEPCHKACNGCYGTAQSACIECSIGWAIKGNMCTDINECNNSSACATNEYCINSEGSYECHTCDMNCKTCIGTGPANCSSCDRNSTLLTGKCIDDFQLQLIWNRVLIKIMLFISIIVILLTILQRATLMVSIVILSISILFYYYESVNEVSFLDFLIFRPTT